MHVEDEGVVPLTDGDPLRIDDRQAPRAGVLVAPETDASPHDRQLGSLGPQMRSLSDPGSRLTRLGPIGCEGCDYQKARIERDFVTRLVDVQISSVPGDDQPGTRNAEGDVVEIHEGQLAAGVG